MQGKLPNFSFSNPNAETGKETKGITFLTFLRLGLPHWNNEGFWKIRSQAHTSCRLSSKCIFWLNFLCTDFLIIDTHYSSAQSGAGALKECLLPSVLQPSFPALQRRLRASWENTSRTGRTGSLEISLGQISPVIMWAHTSCPEQCSHGGKAAKSLPYHAYRVEKTQFSWLNHKHPHLCLHKEFHSLCYPRAVVPLDNSRSHTHSLFIFCASAM